MQLKGKTRVQHTNRFNVGILFSEHYNIFVKETISSCPHTPVIHNYVFIIPDVIPWKYWFVNIFIFTVQYFLYLMLSVLKCYLKSASHD